MSNILELTPKKIEERMRQADEMAEIWDENDNPVHMYLKGCIVTAKALSENNEPECELVGSRNNE